VNHHPFCFVCSTLSLTVDCKQDQDPCQPLQCMRTRTIGTPSGPWPLEWLSSSTCCLYHIGRVGCTCLLFARPLLMRSLLSPGATHLQMGAAISSIIAMVLFNFTFQPLVVPLDYIAHPTLFKQTAMNMVTRFISFATAALVALMFYGLLKCLESCRPVKQAAPAYARI
jgi:hypothetical protein